MKTEGMMALMLHSAPRRTYRAPSAARLEEVMSSGFSTGFHADPKEGFNPVEACVYVKTGRMSGKRISAPIEKLLYGLNDSKVVGGRDALLDGFSDIVSGDLSSNPELDEKRSWMCIDWLYRVYIPATIQSSGRECSFDSHPEIKTVADIDPIEKEVDSLYASVWTNTDKRSSLELDSIMESVFTAAEITEFEEGDSVENELEFLYDFAKCATSAAKIDRADTLKLFRSAVDLVRRQSHCG